jgi:putative peptide zinc metalloprotease protein
VYQLFFKLLGVFLFVVEIAWFILRPLRLELDAWLARSGRILQSGRTWLSAVLVVGLVSLAFIPWPGRIASSALLKPAEIWPVHAPAGARLDALPFKEGDAVAEGAKLAAFHMPDPQMKRQTLLARIEQLRWQAEASAFDEQTRSRVQVAREALATAFAMLRRLRRLPVGFGCSTPIFSRVNGSRGASGLHSWCAPMPSGRSKPGWKIPRLAASGWATRRIS